MSFPLSYMLLLLAGSQQKEQERIAGGDPLLIEVGNSGEEKIYMGGIFEITLSVIFVIFVGDTLSQRFIPISP